MTQSDITSPDKMVPIGTCRITKSQIYGEYNSVCFCRVDLLKVYDLPQKGHDWLNKFHPSKYFVSYGWDEKFKKNRIERYVNFYTPLEAYNRDWKKNNPDCQFLKDVRHPNLVRELPSGISLKYYEKWLSQSIHVLESYLNPDDFPVLIKKQRNILK